MNTKLVKTVLLYTLFGTLGGTLGSMVGQLIIDKMDENEAERLINRWVEPEDEDNEDLIETEENDNSDEDIISTVLKEKTTKETTNVTDYGKFNKHQKRHMANNKSVSDVVKERLGESILEEDPNSNKPHVISLINYVDPSSNNEKVSLTYYEGDDTLCDQQETIIPNCEELLGDDGLLSFGIASDDPDVVYIRNNKMGTDYEVARVPGLYSEIVAGIIPEKEKPSKAKKGKKFNEGEE
jgi:hypothetical protein